MYILLKVIRKLLFSSLNLIAHSFVSYKKFLFTSLTLIVYFFEGYEKKVLDNPHCVHAYGQCIYHTKILRLYYVNVVTVSGSSDLDTTPPSPSSNPSTTSSSTRGPHLLHKTFHLAQPMAPSSVKINGDQGALYPNLYMDEIMSRVRRWIVLKGNLLGLNHFLLYFFSKFFIC